MCVCASERAAYTAARCIITPWHVVKAAVTESNEPRASYLHDRAREQEREEEVPMRAPWNAN